MKKSWIASWRLLFLCLEGSQGRREGEQLVGMFLAPGESCRRLLIFLCPPGVSFLFFSSFSLKRLT